VAGVPSSRSKTDKSGVVLRRQQKVDPKLCESTDGQSVEAQARQLTKAGCKKVFREVASGAKTDRAQLRRLLDQLEAGDVLTVTRLDRLARSTRDLLNTLAAITAKKAGFKSLGDTWADTTTSHGRLMLTVLGGLAEFERDLIRARTGEGRARAVARGQKMGRPFKLTDHQKREAIRRRDACRHRSHVQRQPGDDFEAGSAGQIASIHTGRHDVSQAASTSLRASGYGPEPSVCGGLFQRF
jgi:DNA invertase Pin-like site-specific DNA recombinase